MTLTPLVSIVISTFNRSNILKYTIATVLKQTYQHFEIIVIGDHCTDDTEEVVNSFADDRISFYNLEENFGEQSYPNNIGFQRSKGELLAWLNHDDLWYPEHLQVLVDEISRTDSDLVYSWYLPYNFQQFNRFYNLPVFNEENKHYPFLTIPASTWLLKSKLVTEIGLWKSAWEIYNVPSQNWLGRVYKAGKKITIVNRLTTIAIHSGCRKDSYLNREESEHEEVFNQMYTAEFRESILTELCTHMAYRFNRISLKQYIKNIFKIPLNFLIIKYQLNPNAWFSVFIFKKKGGAVNHYRSVRGLPHLNRNN
ncbi:glycosyltransferase [Emticicia sp. CRIBPO]|uniref:glycosyltransferase family 2 protein n=1 Tax=Emticicia sp. CRIBPO TaxID=2683258 RepID=UPI0014120C04|nr:glycosyltransferase family 2 protein [Emticicia sp. CRIBPO]NBA84913.1 glycosyltransferase [Emticicia sp. CRIBPO]